MKHSSVKQSIGWSFAESLGIKLVSTLVFFVLARVLGAGQFGLVALAYAFTDIGNIVVEQGMVAALVQKEKLERAHLDTAFWINVGLGVLVFGVMVAAAPLVGHWYGEPPLTPVLRATALVFLIGPAGLVQQAQLTRAMDFKTIAKVRIAAILASAVVGLALALEGYGVWALVGQKLVFVLVSTVLFWVGNRWTPRLHFSRWYARELFAFSSKMLLNNFMIYFSRNATELILGFFMGAQAVGLYAFSYKIFQSTIEIANMAVAKVMLPLFSSVQHDKAQLARYFYRAVESAFFLILPFLALLVFLAPAALHAFLGPSWRGSEDLLRLVSAGGAVYMIFYYANAVFVSTGRPGLVVQFNLVNGVLNLLLVAVACQFGLIYVGYAAIARSLLLLPLSFGLLQRVLPVRAVRFAQVLYRPVGVGCVALLVLSLSSLIPALPLGWGWFVVQGGIWAAAVAIALYLVQPSLLAPVLARLARTGPPVGGSKNTSL